METYVKRDDQSSQKEITIIDYGSGNIGSLKNIINKIGAIARVESEPTEINKAKKIILPGVGSFDNAMKRLEEVPDLLKVLHEKAFYEETPFLGICLGMQLLTSGSEEGSRPGLNWISGITKRFEISSGIKVPHIGWNNVKVIRDSILTKGIIPNDYFYFMHSYYIHVEDRRNAIMSTEYGVEFDSIIGSGNIFGVQFHPEKSNQYGIKILHNFNSL